jgi:flagellar biosynthesis protein FlhG
MIRRPLTIAVSGGKGGTGKSMLARNLAVFFSQLSNRVALLDFSETVSSLACLSGIKGWTVAAGEGIYRQKTDLEKLVMLHAPEAPDQLLALYRFEKETRRYDVIVADVPPQRRDALLELFLVADVPLAVVSPEPEAIVDTCEFIARLVFDLVARESEGRWSFEDLSIAVPEETRIARFLCPQDIFSGEPDEALAAFLRAMLREVSVGIVVNGARTPREFETGVEMENFARKVFSLPLVYVGAVEHDERVRADAASGRMALVADPDGRAASDLKKIGRRLVSCPSIRLLRPSWKLGMDGDETFYELLQASFSSPSYEIRNNYAALGKLFSPQSLFHPFIRRRSVLDRLERQLREAFDTVSDKNLRAGYDVMLGSVLQVDVETQDDDVLGEEVEWAVRVSRGKGSGEPITGRFIREARERMGLSFQDIAAATKIGMHYLRAIEEENYVDLPEPVYVKGFLREIARILELDADRVAAAYLRRMKDDLREK